MTEHIIHTEGAAPARENKKDAQVHLANLIEQATAKDAVKDYNASAELYSEATELQAQLNGEMSLDNADLLYAYGKALYNVAVSKSDVLGTKVAGENQTQTQIHASSSETAASSNPASVGSGLVQDAIVSGMAEKEKLDDKSQSEKFENRPYFQFTGDENFDDSGSDDGDEGEDDDDDEEEDDFANAFEVLDLARILYHKKLSSLEECGKGKAADLPPHVKDIKERLADTYDLQAEISLEAERFMDAVTDLRTALDLRQSLFPTEDPCVAECHYKLSLALEFASVCKADAGADVGEGSPKVNEEMRKEAANQMEKAIESCQIRMSQEQEALDSDKALNEDKATAKRRRIANVRDIVTDMEQRLVDLRRSPIALKDQEGESETILKGILGQMMGQPSAQQKVRLDEVKKEANDLSALVKKKSGNDHPAQGGASTQKRSAQDKPQEGNSKRARVGSKSGSPS
ncbi:hypothetical protein BDV25DRAFT_133077 [Aspergillus avenaceus]|uniref:Tetratricopeptide SHNi-TPR domain-containing protein n=1 Tax=Aspergillus avenaceus TaxID=36643 RepID=A0A5N6TIT2_ASPAV|nr:hypothetical protein BDV25DRAFT_133077 [Aspergillus avenaceus]